LEYDVEHLVITQTLLPFLFKNGGLGGRTFDVLMTALPMVRLQLRLDGAASLHPDSKTLTDFRAEQDLVDAETEGLRRARKIITTHSEIAGLFIEKVEHLPWAVPNTKYRRSRGSKVVFPASTLGRKGAFEMRDAARRMQLEVVLCGAQLEDQNFWNGINTEDCAEDWLENASVVVLPAFVENNPRRLLAAAGAGIPVIASAACGLENVAGVTTVQTGNIDMLCAAIETALKQPVTI
jgi:hypothetical protein